MTIYDFDVTLSDGQTISMSQFKNKLLLIVNTATHCGFTPQYTGLETLYQSYKDKGLEVLDFPCNQFMNQAPESDEEINHICEINYQTTFKRFAKIKVNGKDAHPLFKYLKDNAPKELGEQLKEDGGLSSFIFGKKIKWNFTKFLVNREGEIIYRFSSQVTPDKIEDIIKTLV